MPEYDRAGVERCYDLTAEKYAGKLLHELDGKPFDRQILDRFAKLLPKNADVFDMGCGSGHVENYLAEKHGVTVTGLDFSGGMVSVASRFFPNMKFIKGDMLSLDIKDDSIDGIIAFYAIVHFTLADTEKALREFARVLKPGGYALISFHIGSQPVTVDNYFDISGAKATWTFFDPDDIVESIKKISEVSIDEVIIRYPYAGKEHPSRRCYILWSKNRKSGEYLLNS